MAVRKVSFLSHSVVAVIVAEDNDRVDYCTFDDDRSDDYLDHKHHRRPRQHRT